MPIIQAIISKQGKILNTYTAYMIYLDNSYRYFCVCLLFLEPHLSHILRKPLFDVNALQEYILICCQRPQGGLLDKPDK